MADVLGKVPTKERKFKPTGEEMGKFQKAMDDPKFRDMFRDYLEEINDPENLKRREQELLAMEQQGMAPEGRKLVRPKAEFSVSLDVTEEKGKVVINLCSGDFCKDAVFKKEGDGSGKTGVQCQIPYTLGHMRTAEHPETGNLCQLYDIAFSENTMKSALAEEHFKEVVIKTSIEAVDKVLKDCKVKDSEKWKQMKPLGEAAVISISTESLECNDPMNPCLPSFAPKHKVIPNPSGIRLPQYSVRMEASKGVRKVVVCIIMADAGIGDDYADIDINVKIEEQRVTVAYKEQYRLELRLACPLEKEYKVKWKKKKQQLKISLTVLPMFDGKDQRIPYRKPEDIVKMPVGSEELSPTTGKKKTPPAQVKVVLPVKKGFPSDSEVSHGIFTVRVGVPDIVSSSVDTSATSDKQLRISFFTSPVGKPRTLYSGNVELPFDIESASCSMKIAKKNLTIAYRKKQLSETSE